MINDIKTDSHYKIKFFSLVQTQQVRQEVDSEPDDRWRLAMEHFYVFTTTSGLGDLPSRVKWNEVILLFLDRYFNKK